MIRARQLAVRFGSVQALVNVGFEARRGELVVLAGPRGGGRSTLLRVLATLIPPSGGAAEIDGFDVVKDRAAVRTRTLYADGWIGTADGLCVREYLHFVIAARSNSPVDANAIGPIAKRALLAGNERVDSLNNGQRARLALATALGARADVLLLDESLRAVEIETRPLFVEWMRERCASGTAIVLACGDESNVVIAADRTVRLEDGRIASRLRTMAGVG